MNLRSFFEQESFNNNTSSSDELNIAVVALLTSVSINTCQTSREEINVLIEQVSNTFRLTKDEASDLINLVLPLSINEQKMHEFVNILNQKFNIDQKQMVLAMIWRLIEADGKTCDIESSTARDVRNRLNLSFEQAVRARQIAEMDESDFENFKIKLTEISPLDPKNLR